MYIYIYIIRNFKTIRNTGNNIISEGVYYSVLST